MYANKTNAKRTVTAGRKKQKIATKAHSQTHQTTKRRKKIAANAPNPVKMHSPPPVRVEYVADGRIEMGMPGVLCNASQKDPDHWTDSSKSLPAADRFNWNRIAGPGLDIAERIKVSQNGRRYVNIPYSKGKRYLCSVETCLRAVWRKGFCRNHAEKHMRREGADWFGSVPVRRKRKQMEPLESRLMRGNASARSGSVGEFSK